jgi:hypothetical protein
MAISDLIQTTPPGGTATLVQRVGGLTLDGLVKMKRRQLEELFLLAETPNLNEVAGLTDGRILDGVIPFHRLFFWAPWRGKRFVPPVAPGGKGNGRNRMELGGLKTMWYPFETSIKDPLMGTDQVFTLDYALPGNFWPIRIIRDDLKRLKEGLYLGAVFMKWSKRYTFTLYFALGKSASREG